MASGIRNADALRSEFFLLLLYFTLLLYLQIISVSVHLIVGRGSFMSFFFFLLLWILCLS